MTIGRLGMWSAIHEAHLTLFPPDATMRLAGFADEAAKVCDRSTSVAGPAV